MDKKQCKFIRNNGSQCQAWAVKNGQFCFAHAPDKERERILARSRGGKSPRKNNNPLEPIEIKNHEDVVKLISQTINEVREGLADVRVANCVFYGSGQLIKALETADLEKRVTKLEEILKQQNYAS